MPGWSQLQSHKHVCQICALDCLKFAFLIEVERVRIAEDLVLRKSGDETSGSVNVIAHQLICDGGVCSLVEGYHGNKRPS
jgi:hypothetical protein